MKYAIPMLLIVFVSLFIASSPSRAGAGKMSSGASPARDTLSLAEMTGADKRILALANAAAADCARALENAVKSGQKSEEDIFSTLYFPLLPLTSPPSFSTFYDDYTDKVITPIVDAYLAKNSSILSVGLVDRNGYIPSHNSKYSRPLTGSPEVDIKNHRTKRIFNDMTGLQASQSTRPFLLQIYRRDTGETAADLSVPVLVMNRRWGALRVVYVRGE
jgi:methyl-accepting chemotaxis protein